MKKGMGTFLATQKYNKTSSSTGFTIVELLIVIVVIAILAAITIVTYNGVQSRTKASAASSAVNQVAKKLSLFSVENGGFPDSLGTVNITDSDTTKYRYYVNNDTNPKTWCAVATVGESSYYISSSQTSSVEGICAGPGAGNVAPELAYWKSIGNNPSALKYNEASKELIVSKVGTAEARSPLIDVRDSKSVRFEYDFYPTSPSVNDAPNSATHTDSRYLAADGVTLVYNSSGYTSNGNARPYELNVWSRYQVVYTTGPDVKFITLSINSTPQSYTSDARIRNVTVTINR